MMNRHPIGFECQFSVKDEKARQLVKIAALNE
jgi:hypothetical protein